MKYIFVVLLSIIIHIILVHSFFFRSKTNEDDVEDLDMDDEHNEGISNTNQLIVNNPMIDTMPDPTTIPYDLFIPGLMVEFFNDVHAIQFDETSFITRKETIEEQSNVLIGRYRPPPKDIRRQPDAVDVLLRPHWSIEPEQKHTPFPGVDRENFAAIITGKSIPGRYLT